MHKVYMRIKTEGLTHGPGTTLRGDNVETRSPRTFIGVSVMPAVGRRL
jgi:hypothetical protein